MEIDAGAITDIAGNFYAGIADANTFNFTVNTTNTTAGKIGVYGTLVVTNATGDYTFIPNDAAIEGLKTNTTENFTVTVTDGSATSSTNFTINITGANDSATFSGNLSGSITEDSAQIISGMIVVADRDVSDATTITTQTGTTGNYGAFNIDANGQWTYTLNNAASNVQALQAGQVASDNFTVVTADGTTQAITISVNGANDAPTLTGSKATLDAGTKNTIYTITLASLLVGFADVDGDTLTVTGLSATNGTLSAFDPVTQNWTFTPATNYSGIVDLSYNVTDGVSAINATQSFNLNAVNNSGLVTISGSAVQGQTLTATVADADGLSGNITYQWKANNIDIAGATANTYTISAADAGMAITVSAGYIDNSNHVENILSAATAEVNYFVGTTGADILSGTIGADRLEGLTGNDTYVVNNAGDVVIETSILATEVDTVESSVHYTLGANIENLTLTGTAAINATGNNLNNILIGNAAANILNGGAGNDVMAGGIGDDVYTIDVLTDVITENANEGIDLVNVTVASGGGTYTLAANVENATLINAVAYSLTGNAQDNVLTGNSATNSLKGGGGNDTLDGGLGNDILAGGSGSDLFSFSSALSGTNIDTIKDFLRGTDRIALDATIFTQLLNDTNLSDNIIVRSLGNKARDANDYLIFNSTTKALYYDADGSGSTYAPIQFATLTNITTLSASDFVVI